MRTGWNHALRALFVMFALSAASHAQPDPPGGDRAERSDKIDRATRAALNRNIERRGAVRVLIGLNTNSEPDAALTMQQAARDARSFSRRSAIARLQSRALSRAAFRRPHTAERFEDLPYIVAEVDESDLRRLEAMDEVSVIVEDRLHAPSLDVSVPAIGADIVHLNGFTGLGSAVAILDTGVERDHVTFLDAAQLNSRVVEEACYSTTSALSNSTSLCPNGINPGGVDSQTGINAAAPCTAVSGCFHGTHVAGIAAGSEGAHTGVAPGAFVIAIQVFSLFNDPGSCGGAPSCVLAFTSDIIRGLQRVYALRLSYNIAAANLSLGGGFFDTRTSCDVASPATKSVIDDLRAAGIATVIASGNDGFINGLNAPGCLSSAVAVGASTSTDSVASFSNSASWLPFLAPGTGIASALPGVPPGNLFGNANGTSMAAPHVAGALAVLRELTPGASLDEMLAALSMTGISIVDESVGFDTPRIQLDAAADRLQNAVAPLFDLILDNDSSGTLQDGVFSLQTLGANYGGDALYADGVGIDTWRFTPVLPATDLYRVWLWASGGGDNSRDVLVTINDDAGPTTRIVNQQVNGKRWRPLGDFTLSDGTAFVEISDSGGTDAIADAVRFVRLSDGAELAIEAVSLPGSTRTDLYSVVIGSSGGGASHTFSLASGTLPPGLALQSDGSLFGTTDTAGVFSFVVQVADELGGSAQRAYAIAVSEEPLLYWNDFTGSAVSDWTVIDDGDINGPSDWNTLDGVAIERSGMYSLPLDGESVEKPGTWLLYDIGSAWVNYRVQADIRSVDDDAFGVMFRVADTQNWYRFSWDQQRGYRRLVKTVGGVTSTLAQDHVPYVSTQGYALEIIAKADYIEIRIDGASIFQVYDPDVTQGSIGLYAWANAGASFDNLLVTDLSSVNLAPVVHTVSAAPSSIFDIEFSDLSVSATDPESAPLTLIWSSPAGGSFDDPTSSTPRWTPPDLPDEQSQVFTLNVTVTDDQFAQSVASVEVTVHDPNATLPPLLDEDFASGSLAGWTVVDQGTVFSPSSWSAASGILTQGSNIYSTPADATALAKLGTYLRFDGGAAWTDYRTSFTLRSSDDDTLGLMFRVVDSQNWYRFSWDQQRLHRRLEKSVGGVVTILAQDAVPYTQNQTYLLEITAQGALLEVRIDGAVVLSALDSSHTGGTIAPYTWAHNGARFDDLLVEVLAGGNLAPVINSVSATPTSISDEQFSDLVVDATDPEAGPLTVMWSSPAGGSFDDPTSSTPRWTPPDLPDTESQVFTLNVTVTDDQSAQSLGSVDVTVTDPNAAPPPLLDEDFASGSLAGWTVVDEGTVFSPSSWSAASGFLTQGSNIYSTPADATAVAKLGTYLRFDGGAAWTDYRTSFTLRSSDDDTLGMMFRVVDAQNWYRFSWDQQRLHRRLEKSVGGVVTILAQDAVPYTQNQTYLLEITAQGALLEVRIDGAVVLSALDSSHTGGTIAPYTWAHNGARFDDLLVEVLAGGNLAPVINSVSATPTSISDEQFSDLVVDATDPEAGPLTVLWSSPAGGSFDDPTSSTPRWTPPDLPDTESQVFTLNVTVTDDQSAQSLGSVDVTVTDPNAAPPPLLDEDFASGALAGWTVVDEGTQFAPSSWSAAGGILTQGSNIYSAPADATAVAKPGTFLRFDGGAAWTDYRTSFTLRSSDDDTLGLMFRVVDAQNWYRFSWDQQRLHRRLEKSVGGVVSILAQDAVPYTQNQTYLLEITAQGALLEVRIDGAVVLSALDSSHTGGTIAPYTWAHNGARFDDLLVEVLAGGNLAPVINSVSATPTSISDEQFSDLVVDATDPEAGPLTVLWSSPAGGSFDDPTSSTPRWTPPDLPDTESQVFTLNVTVTDDQSAQSLGSVDVTVTDPNAAPPPLLDEDFASGALAGWTVVDEGTQFAPSSWSAAGGILTQGSNIYSAPADATAVAKPGTFLRFDGGAAWTDYRTSFTLRSSDDDTLGLMFRVVDAQNWYRFSWDQQRLHRRLEKSVGGVVSILAQDAVPYTQNQTYLLEITAQGALLEVRIDGAVVLSALDSSHTGGTIAPYTWAHNGARFDDLLVEVLAGGNLAPVINSVSATPTSISDEQFSDLVVDATDPEAGPLTVLWSSPAGGSFDDPTSSTPRWTPPDLPDSESQVFTLNVTVTDDQSAQSLGSVDVTVTDPNAAPPPLLDEDFASGALAGWTVVDEGTQFAPSSWSAAGGILTQGSNIYSAPTDATAVAKPGTFLLYDGGAAWTDYQVSFTLRSSDDDTLGLMFRVVDAQNWYRFSWDQQRSQRRLEKSVGGVVSILHEDAVPYVQGLTYLVEVSAQGDSLEVRIDGAPILSAIDAEHSGGTIAPYTWAHNGARFDDLLVDGL